MFKKLIFILILPIFLSACVGSSEKLSRPINLEAEEKVEQSAAEIPLAPMFFSEQFFYPAIEQSQSIEAQADTRAIIVPHHLLASTLIAQAFKQASGRAVDKVIIIGPNHENIGYQAISTADVNWQTNLGTVYSDKDLVRRFMADLNLKENSEAFTNEHSIGAQTSFIKHFFPTANVLAITLSSYTDREDVNNLSQWLVKNIDDQTLVVFSIDFSHYLDKEKASEMDKITKELIENRDIDKIMKLTNDNVDSPASLAIALFLADKLSLKTNILAQGNSFDFSDIKEKETTSYFVISFEAR